MNDERAASPPDLDFEGATVRYGGGEGATALDGVDLSLPNDRVTAIVGPSGSGKSTLLRLSNGLVRPTAGTVRVFGAPIDFDRLPQLRRQIGWAVQGTGLFPHMTVEGNISLLARLVHWSPESTRARVAELLRLVSLPESLLTRHPHELSGGQAQRVGLCRAMMIRPRVFLLDEAFGALDPLTRRDLQDGFLEIQRAEPRTVVLVTHDIREARRLATHLVVLRDGRVAQAGATADVIERPADDFVAEFVKAQLA